MKDYGTKLNGRPRKCPPRPQEGNAAWRVAAKAIALKKGNANRQTCSRSRKDGTKCHKIAVRGSAYCYRHGGWAAIPKNRLEDNRKAKAHRYARWSLDANQRKDNAPTEAEKPNIAANTTGYGL